MSVAEKDVQQAQQDQTQTPQDKPVVDPTQIDARFNNIESQFDKLIDTVGSMIDANENKQQQNQQPQPSPGYKVSADEIDELGFDEKQVKFIEKVTSATAEETAKRVVQNFSSESRTQTLTEQWDNKAATDFPDLNQRNSKMRQMYESVKKENQQINPGWKNDPKFVYNTALEAERRLNQAATPPPQKNISQNYAPRKRFQSWHLESSTNTSGINSGQNDNEVSEERQQLRGLFGSNRK